MPHLDAQSMDIRAADRFVTAEEQLGELHDAFPGGPRERLHQLPLFLPPHVLRRIAFLDALYRQIVPVHGAIMEFGVRFGRDLAIFDSLRMLHEPLNYGRKIVGFDTFTGFPSVDEKDGEYGLVHVGGLHTGDDYDAYLEQVLEAREQLGTYEHLRKFEIVKGDATETLAAYLERNQHTIVALAYFDFDIYQPTKDCLELLRGHLTKGSVLAFDELNCPDFPGETLAVKEVFGLDRYAIRRIPGVNPGMPSYLVID
ncbi:TylF/MycF/NovP-related O-methyltransferase [Conexibacter sp. CPCC 206217]|uniref:TylF/MycF/NovP-related O-methyltransferase n=1 Tax=Conexibacter sp. CPCC 206217 TaxID=3064574 RepID=UPI00271A566C|nr:TylF/MycF/NovP-related O-methyltransferase [Conexibacter sp. CPCC 206217]MDO8211368.1 TylF/MycF/NovP-related O-methyltransferase [Conexibacter sp. CPCC 206217]